MQLYKLITIIHNSFNFYLYLCNNIYILEYIESSRKIKSYNNGISLNNAITIPFDYTKRSLLITKKRIYY